MCRQRTKQKICLFWKYWGTTVIPSKVYRVKACFFLSLEEWTLLQELIKSCNEKQKQNKIKQNNILAFLVAFDQAW